jgi:hypothetical protein
MHVSHERLRHLHRGMRSANHSQQPRGHSLNMNDGSSLFPKFHILRSGGRVNKKYGSEGRKTLTPKSSEQREDTNLYCLATTS